MQPLWLNGKPQAAISVLDRGLAYGDGVFETLRIHNTSPSLFYLHIDRLSSSCERLNIQLDLAVLLREIEAYIQQYSITSGVLKIIITRGSGGRGYNPAGCDEHRRILASFQAPEYPETHSKQGIRLFDCQTRLGISPATAGMKHLNRLEQVLARSEWNSDEFAEGLMQDIDLKPVEGTMSNLFVVSGGTLSTPDLSQSGVAGVCREFILRQAKIEKLDVAITSLSLEDMYNAEEVFVCNSVAGVWPVISYQNRSWPVGKLTKRIQGWVNKAIYR
ncbi:aminodeoxychorismate lyase [Aestuariirhabdus sp. Z084]|uniref:aminodeoxychorismate lyase n=1 Tax=Aestuariirhabdus haliotis TaxID=2918751 RepID=UPI00201B3681|nr:aminodeoxychorismate lyase [Aestuariirhabdus haliotis]MCL6414805.1 aminodeoxychorismate lyase [Aestuariirhabdus haliotis]MCL6418737.1 aminodeoxychorismate lyase [Aestuariirhabdus haliotis]